MKKIDFEMKVKKELRKKRNVANLLSLCVDYHV